MFSGTNVEQFMAVGPDESTSVTPHHWVVGDEYGRSVESTVMDRKLYRYSSSQ